MHRDPLTKPLPRRRRAIDGAQRTVLPPLLARALLLAALLAATPAALARDAAPPAHGVIGVSDAQLSPEWWIGRHPAPRQLLATEAQIEQRNARLWREDPAVHALEELPPRLPGSTVRERIGARSQVPDRTLYDGEGRQMPRPRLQAMLANAALDAVADEVPLRWGMVVSRADMRTLPSTLRVFHSADDSDIDRFQETALFPGTPLALLHESADGGWWFAIAPTYAAWIEKRHVGIGQRDVVLAHGRRAPFLVVTGARVETVHTPEAPALSAVQLDMGVRLPLRADWPADRAVNGQHPYASHVVELPYRDATGGLAFAPALVPRSADVATGYLPLTSASLLRQAFKFLGERYGWGHSYNARDCSGFVSEVLRSHGVLLPRNTSDQARTPVFERIAFDADDDASARTAVLRALDVGDLIYIPGHVMMVVGQTDEGPYVIHDTTGIAYVEADGTLRRVSLNQVAVTPLLPLMADAETRTIERITAIQRLPRASSVPRARFPVPASPAPAQPADDHQKAQP